MTLCSDKMKKLSAVFALVIVFIGFIIFVTAPSETSLQLVHILFRHGERSPSKSYKTDPYKDYQWPGGWDQLSITGKQQEHKLGLLFRKRYKKFLNDEYDPRTVYMDSSYADRCLMSAELLLAGLFPPHGNDIWNEDLPWQPIPVHSLPRYLDNKIALKRNCPKFQQYLNESYESLANDNIRNQHLYNYLSENTGDEIRDIRELETLYNTLEIEQLNGLKLPDWTRTVFPDKMRDLAASNLALYTKTTPMKRLHGGVLAKEIVDRMFAKARKQTESKLFMYSGHDLTVVTLLRVFGFPELIKPDFAAAVIIELHKFNVDEFIVKFFYLANPESAPRELDLDGCGERGCELSRLNQLLAAVLPDDWEAECKS